MDIESLLRESRAERIQERIGLETDVGKEQFGKQLRKFTSNIGVLQRRQETLLELRKSLTPETESTLDALFHELHTLEPELKLFFSRTAVETDSYGQLLFSGWSSLQVFNTIPFVLLCLSIYKQYIVPALAVLMPLFMVIMPYIFLTYISKIAISPEQYVHILMNMFGLQNLDLTNPRTILQGSLTLFSIGQSIYQPIQNALHLQTIHKEMMKKTHAAQRIVHCVESLQQFFPSSKSLQACLDDIPKQDEHRLFAEFWDSPYKLRWILTTIGDCEVVYRLAKTSSIKPVEFLAGKKPFLQIHQGVDPFLETAIPFELKLSGKTHHAILTGPNRGGKSSVLRSTLLNIVLAQTFGMGTLGETGFFLLRPFDWIATGLRLEDRPGSTSMFESEVEFSLQILQRAKATPDQLGFLVFDELFHSTNPPDGARTADIFLQKLWQTPNTASFISTHVFDLAKKAPKHIQKLCVPAHKGEGDSLTFTYTLQKGICEVSSVDLILKEKGLLSA